MISFYADRVLHKQGFAPSSFSGTTAVETAAIDRLGFNTAFIIFDNAAATGTPTAVAITMTFADGATSSPATAVTFAVNPAVVNALAAGCVMYTFDLSNFNRYFKMVATPAFTDGTAPAVIGACAIILADSRVDPASGTAVVPLKKA